MDSERVSILVVDDEPAIIRALTTAFTARGYSVVTAATGEEAIDRVMRATPTAIVLDLGLPDIDGVQVCRRIRTWSDVPIIVLTAEGLEDRKVAALDEGADDYVTKPFSMPELLARLRVALRHRRPARAVLDETVHTIGDLRIDVALRAVTVGGEAVELTPKEFGFLLVLARHPGRVVTHRMILQEVWGPEFGTETQYLRVYAGRLRKKLGDDPLAPRLVTAPGVGYSLVDPEPGQS
jgi:two-component system KDP operon response regulator KdpE